MGKLSRQRDRIARQEATDLLEAYRVAFAALADILEKRPNESLLDAARRLRAERDAERVDG